MAVNITKTDIEILVDNVRAQQKKLSPEFKEELASTLEALYREVERLRKSARVSVAGE